MFIHELVARQASAAPDAIAIAGEKQLTYGELDRRANRLARRLVALGVGGEVPVALFLERSAELAVAALAVLKAGGAYVPLDPGYPRTRIALLLDDCAAPVVLTHSSVAGQLPAGKWQTIVLDREEEETSEASAEAPVHATGSEINPDSSAYIIFTSGSTGRPKGVQITHANLLNLVQWHQRAFQITAADRATLQASPGFDAAVWEIWPYLAAGASVYVVEDSLRPAPERLRDWIIEKGITITFLPTAVAEAMVNFSWPTETTLRFLLTGADTLRRYPPPNLPFALVNNYGPSECTVVATSGEIRGNGESEGAPSIGRVIDNVEIHIVDEQLKPVANGVAGELLIGGAGVGKGYLNRIELTAQKFVFDPFSKLPGARLYCTGDLARVRANGEIEFLGRIDEQIKIRGYRIEPGEVMTVLNRHPAIQSSYVTTYANGAGENNLVAYVVAAQGRPTLGELRAFVGEHLPEYMVPSTFVTLRELPMTAHGKVDRAALPKPTAENRLDDEHFEAAQSEVEQWLASFLTGLLKVSRVGRDDNFFNLGGHSLMGAQLIAKVQQRFGVELSLRGLFDHPTIAEISSGIERLIYAKLQMMSDEEAQRLLESSPGISV